MESKNLKNIPRKLDMSLIVKATERCNLNCPYCYLDFKRNSDLDEETAEKLIKEILDNNEHYANFTWVGGEPLLREDSFFESIREIQKKHNYKKIPLQNSIQTNGVSLTPERFDKLKSMGYKIGISFDGTPDLQRIRMNEKQVNDLLKTIEHTKHNVGLLGVLTSYSIGREEEIYDFYRNHTTFAKINFFTPSGEGAKVDEEMKIPQKDAANMLVKFYEMWRDDDSSLELRPTLENVKSFFTGYPTACDYSAISCYKIIGADSEGNIYPCSKAMNFPELRMGHIDDGLKNMLDSEIHQGPLKRYIQLKEGEQRENQWLHLSGGGCPIEAKSQGDYFKGTRYSYEVRNALFDKIYGDMQNERTREKLEKKVGLI